MKRGKTKQKKMVETLQKLVTNLTPEQAEGFALTPLVNAEPCKSGEEYCLTDGRDIWKGAMEHYVRNGNAALRYMDIHGFWTNKNTQNVYKINSDFLIAVLFVINGIEPK